MIKINSFCGGSVGNKSFFKISNPVSNSSIVRGEQVATHTAENSWVLPTANLSEQSTFTPRFLACISK